MQRFLALGFALIVGVSASASVSGRLGTPDLPSPPTAIRCHDLLISSHITALAWNTNDHLVPILNLSLEPVRSLLKGIPSWVDERETFIVPLQIRGGVNRTVLGPSGAWLPSPLRSIFERGGRFETSTESSTAFSLWMVVPPGGARGRSGVLLYHGKPILIIDPVTGREYLVELKGAGLPRGGYDRIANKKSLQGGLWGLEAQHEYHRLQMAARLHRGEGVIGLGWQAFEDRHGPQELLLRLTPGNFRASYQIGGGRLEDALDRYILLFRMGQQLGELLTQGYGAITHPENFVLDHPAQRVFATDFLDVLPLWDWPQLADKVRGERDVVEHSLKMFRLSHAYEGYLGNHAFFDGFRVPLAKFGWHTEILEDLYEVGPAKAAKQIFTAGLAAQIFEKRRQVGYDPLEESGLAKELKRPCADPRPSLAGVEASANLISGFKHAYLSTEEFALLNNYAEGQVSAEELITHEVIIRALDRIRNLDLELDYPNASFGANDLAGILSSSFPGLMELKRNLERENFLIRTALVSHPNSLDLRESLLALKRAIKIYRETSLMEFRDMICNHRENAFKRLFYLPHHVGYSRYH